MHSVIYGNINGVPRNPYIRTHQFAQNTPVVATAQAPAAVPEKGGAVAPTIVKDAATQKVKKFINFKI